MTSNPAQIESAFRRLGLLHGTWRGKGTGRYPTIDPFDYEETLRFELDQSYPILHYEQRTVLQPSGENSHWESGFIRALEDGSIEISSSQDSGRVEVLRGRLTAADGRDDALDLAVDSVVLGHDPRLVRTGRRYVLRGDSLRYVVHMATTTTPAPQYQQHLEAALERTR